MYLKLTVKSDVDFDVMCEDCVDQMGEVFSNRSVTHYCKLHINCISYRKSLSNFLYNKIENICSTHPLLHLYSMLSNILLPVIKIKVDKQIRFVWGFQYWLPEKSYLEKTLTDRTINIDKGTKVEIETNNNMATDQKSGAFIEGQLARLC